MRLLTFSNTDIQFVKKEFVWRTYSRAETFPTTRKMKLIVKKKFSKAVLNKDVKVFVIHVSFLGLA